MLGRLRAVLTASWIDRAGLIVVGTSGLVIWYVMLR